MNVHEHFKVFEFTEMGDERGNLVVIEGKSDVPFEIKRIFYMYGTDGNWVRGQHANRKSDFVLVNVAGRSKVKIDDGFSTAVIELNKPRMGIYIPRMIWKEMYGPPALPGFRQMSHFLAHPPGLFLPPPPSLLSPLPSLVLSLLLWAFPGYFPCCRTLSALP